MGLPVRDMTDDDDDTNTTTSDDRFTYPNRQNKPFQRKTFDPQIILEGNLRQGAKADVIVFKLRILIVDVTCVVTIPPDGETKAPVYVKFRIDYSQNQPPGSVIISDHSNEPEVRHVGRFEETP